MNRAHFNVEDENAKPVSSAPIRALQRHCMNLPVVG